MDETTPHQKPLSERIRHRMVNKIYGIWFLRYAIPLFALELFILIGALSFFAKRVFVEKAVSNALAASFGNPLKLLAYLWGSFLATSPFTQIIIVLLIAIGLLLLRDMNRSIISYAHMRRNQIRRTPL